MIRRGQSGGRAPDGASFQERDMDHHQAVRTLAAQLSGSGGSFDTITRLHHLELEGSSRRFLIEAFCKREELNQAWRLEISVLSLRVGLDLDEMVGKRANLRTTLSDGSEFWCSGLVIQAAADDSDGGFARYRLIVVPWVELLKHTRRSQAWQEKSVIEILESVFSQYSAYASWRWADCVAAHLDKSPHNCTGKHRSYVLQHKQSDWDFVARIMAEEHLIFRFERDEGAPLGHTMVILADTVDPKSCPEDTCSASPLGGQGIRYTDPGSSRIRTPSRPSVAFGSCPSRWPCSPAGISRPSASFPPPCPRSAASAVTRRRGWKTTTGPGPTPSPPVPRPTALPCWCRKRTKRGTSTGSAAVRCAALRPAFTST
jgi:hypothetical protein